MVYSQMFRHVSGSSKSKMTAVFIQLTETETEIANELRNNHQLTETETELTIKTETGIETEKFNSVN
jgi:hypothetical protein